jgi:hypothetical protein
MFASRVEAFAILPISHIIHHLLLLKMHLLSLLTIPTLVLASPLISKGAQDARAAAGKTPFVGEGILGLYRVSDGQYVGCASAEGYWNSDSTKCGTFSGTKDRSSQTYRLKTDLGQCGTGVVKSFKDIGFFCNEPLQQGLDYWEVSVLWKKWQSWNSILTRVLGLRNRVWIETED